MRRAWLPPLVVALLTALGIATVLVAAPPALVPPDTVAAHDLVVAAEQSWPDAPPDFVDLAAPFTTATLIDGEGNVVATHGRAVTSELEAHRQGASTLTLRRDGQPVGVLYVAESHAVRATDAWRAWRLAAAGAVSVVGMAGLGLLLWQRHRVLRPFARLEEFATEVAAGHLDAPLAMDRGNVFGPFTEAFDLMREELRTAREQERIAKESKKDLVAELGHDIRTPVASIGATAELLALTEDDADRRAKLGVVQDMARQIEALVADLFRANEDELAVLRVEPEEVASTHVADWLRATDPLGSIRPFTLPECLVHADPLRLKQVFDNVVANSRKYAATPIDVTGSLGEDLLTVVVRDSGPGVPEGELDQILGKGVRGSNVGESPGLGIGLYTSSYLMERMGGSLSCRRAEPGLAVEIGIPLAR